MHTEWLQIYRYHTRRKAGLFIFQHGSSGLRMFAQLLTMDLLNPQKGSGIPLSSGKLLIAEPFLGDPNFSRSVILLCEYGEEGSVGFSLNHQSEYTLGDLIPEAFGAGLPVYYGGPVSTDTLHMLHQNPEILGGIEVFEGLYWGGNFETLQTLLSQNPDPDFALRLFVGYAGWGSKQLDQEIEEGSWLIANPSAELVFNIDPKDAWKEAIDSLGSGFAHLKNMPIDPQLN